MHHKSNVIIFKCFDQGIEEVSKIKDVKEMSEQEIRSVLLKWEKVWDKGLEKLNEKKDSIEENFLHDIDDEIESVIEFRN